MALGRVKHPDYVACATFVTWRHGANRSAGVFIIHVQTGLDLHGAVVQRRIFYRRGGTEPAVATLSRT